MADFFGNSMFGHNFKATAFQQNHGHSTSSFGSSGKKSHDTGIGGSGFGQSSGAVNSHEMHHGGGVMMNRQNSILSEMTRTKEDKGGNPWIYTPTPGHVENGHVTSLYEKPLETEKEKKRRPSLKKQTTLGEWSNGPRRAPSFASDPDRMRSRTVSVSSAPGGPGRVQLQRGVSICDEPDEPMNMDRARPVLRRSQTMAAAKERRRSEASIKKPLLPFHMPKFARRKSSSAMKSLPNSETTSLSTTPQRSRSNTADSERPAQAYPPAPNRGVSEPKASVGSKSSIPNSENNYAADEDPEQAKLILSLLAPATDDVFETSEPEGNHNIPNKELHERILESPTMVSKKIQQYLPPEQDRSVLQQPKTSKPAAKLYHGKSFLDGHFLHSVEPTDSESSDSYYDCLPQEDNGIPNRKVKKRIPRRKRNISSSTCTDGEDTTSTSGSPIINKHITPSYHNNDPYPVDPVMTFQATKNDKNYPDYQYEAETLPVRAIQNKPLRAQPSVKTYIYKQSPSTYPNLTITVPNNTVKQKIMKYETELKAENEPKDLAGNDTCTADSSESGYATSHKPLSPKDCDMKVFDFVNSLPIHPDLDEEHSDDVVNGSDTETDTEEHNNLPESILSNMKCVSGSETDEESIDSNDTTSKLEVMKLLESPSEVAARVESTLKASNRKLDDDSSTRSSRRKNSNSSQTEVLQLFRKENEDEPDSISERFIKIHENPVEVNCVFVEAKQTGSPLESPNTESHVLKSSHKSTYSFFEKPMLSFRSTNSYQKMSNCTQCIDLLLSCLNVVLFLTSAAVIALGLWLLLKNFNVNEMTEILGNNLLQVIIYLSIGGAGAAMLAAFCLCCGVRHDKTGLGFYTVVLVIVIFAFATAAVLSAMFADKLGGIEFRINFRDRLVSKYGINNEKDSQFFTGAWDKMHQEFECCGVEGNINDTASWAVFKKFSLWYRKQPYKATIFVPESCCKPNANTEVCQGSDHNLLGPPVYGPPIDKYYPHRNSNLNTDGCYELFAGHASMVVAWTALVTGGLAGLYFIVVMLTWVFCFKKSSQEDTESYYGDSHYDLEVHNNVFEETDGTHLRHRAPNSTIEETVLLKQPPVTVHRVPNENDKINTSTRNIVSDPVVETKATTLAAEARDETTSVHTESDSDKDGDSDNDQDQYDDSINRRNMWLSSESRAPHLLSLAITEEGSNFEDSDDEERDKLQTTAFV